MRAFQVDISFKRAIGKLHHKWQGYTLRINIAINSRVLDFEEWNILEFSILPHGDDCFAADCLTFNIHYVSVLEYFCPDTFLDLVELEGRFISFDRHNL